MIKSVDARPAAWPSVRSLLRRCSPRRALLGIGLVLTMAGCAEEQTKETGLADRLTGEWVITLRAAQPTDASGFPVVHSTDGVLVFDRRIECYLEDTGVQPGGDRICGRAYIAFARLMGVRDSTLSAYMGQGRYADRAEDAMAQVDSAGAVTIALAPSAGGNTLYGRSTADSIQGHLALTSPRGAEHRWTFSMRRVPRSSFSDSALIRSRSGVRQWESAAGLKDPPEVGRDR
jgi:hypothetical protein